MALLFNGSAPEVITYNGNPVDEVYYNNVKVWPDGTPPVYQVYDYIQSSGTQYIDTGLPVTNNTSFEIECCPNVVNHDNKIFGAYDGTNGVALGTYRSKWRLGSQWSDNSIPCTTTKTYIKGEGTMWRVGTTYVGVSEGITSLNQNMYVFCTNYNGSPMAAACKVWTLKIYDNGTLIRDYVPVKRISDNSIGLYDKENEIFYPNAGTGTFTPGSVIGNI